LKEKTVFDSAHGAAQALGKKERGTLRSKEIEKPTSGEGRKKKVEQEKRIKAMLWTSGCKTRRRGKKVRKRGAKGA